MSALYVILICCSPRGPQDKDSLLLDGTKEPKASSGAAMRQAGQGCAEPYLQDSAKEVAKSLILFSRNDRNWIGKSQIPQQAKIFYRTKRVLARANRTIFCPKINFWGLLLWKRALGMVVGNLWAPESLQVDCNTSRWPPLLSFQGELHRWCSILRSQNSPPYPWSLSGEERASRTCRCSQTMSQVIQSKDSKSIYDVPLYSIHTRVTFQMLLFLD